MRSDLLRQSFSDQTVTIALSALLLVAVLNAGLSLRSGVFLSATLAALGFALILLNLRNHQRSGLSTTLATLSILCLWIALATSPTVMVMSMAIMVLAAYLLLSLNRANATSLLGLLIYAFMHLDSMSMGINVIYEALGAVCLMALMNAITRQFKHDRKMLKGLQVTDTLSGCLNRKALQHELAKASKMSQRYNVDVTILVIEIKNHADLIHEFGYNLMDGLIREWVEVCASRMRNTDMFCRYSDACFVCLLLATPYENAQPLMNDLVTASGAYDYGDSIALDVSVHAVQHKRGETWEDWLARSFQLA